MSLDHTILPDDDGRSTARLSINGNGDDRSVFMCCKHCNEEFIRPVRYAKKDHACLPRILGRKKVFKVTSGAPPRLECKLIHPDAKYPSRKRTTDAGYDVASIDDVVIPKFGMSNIHTGIILVAPPGYYYTVEGRSSLWTKNIMPYRGIIDATYTDQLMIAMMNSSPNDYQVKKGDRIAQIVLHKSIWFDIAPVDEFSDEYRGREKDGFGSSGR